MYLQIAHALQVTRKRKRYCTSIKKLQEKRWTGLSVRVLGREKPKSRRGSCCSCEGLVLGNASFSQPRFDEIGGWDRLGMWIHHNVFIIFRVETEVRDQVMH